MRHRHRLSRLGRAAAGARDRMTQIYDLSRSRASPAYPRFRPAGQQPGATGPAPTELHGPISTGPQGQPRLLRLRHQQGRHPADRRSREAAGRAEGADARRTCAIREVGRLDCRRSTGAHTAFPLLGMPIAEFAKDKVGKVARFRRRSPTSQIQNECQEPRQMRVVRRRHDRDAAGRRSSTWTRAGGARQLLRARRPLRHALVEREHDADLLQARHVLRALQRRRARGRHPRSLSPEGDRATTSRRSPRTPTSAASSSRMAQERCKMAIQTNNVEVDDRGYIYIVDRANTGCTSSS